MLSSPSRAGKRNTRRGFAGEVPGEDGDPEPGLVRRRIVPADDRAGGEQMRIHRLTAQVERAQRRINPHPNSKNLMLPLELLGQQIADVLKKSESATKSLLFRAYETLREQLKEFI